MLYYAAAFLAVALIAGVVGFGGVAASAAGMAKILFFTFLLIAAVSLVIGLLRR